MIKVFSKILLIPYNNVEKTQTQVENVELAFYRQPKNDTLYLLLHYEC